MGDNITTRHDTIRRLRGARASRRGDGLHQAPGARDAEAAQWLSRLMTLPRARLCRVAQARRKIEAPDFDLDAEFAIAMEVFMAQELDAWSAP